MPAQPIRPVAMPTRAIRPVAARTLTAIPAPRGEAQSEGGAADLTDDDVDDDRGDEPDGGDTQAEVEEIEVAAVGSVDAVGG